MQILTHRIGDTSPCFVIAEVAQAHEGSLGIAHSFIDAAAKAGANAVKFQTHIAAEESSPDEPWRKKFRTQDASRYDYWKRMEFSERSWSELKQHADSLGLVFLSSPFSVPAVDLLDSIGVPAWKIASGEITNLLLLSKIAELGKPVILSSGLSPWQEIDKAVDFFKGKKIETALLQCTSSYPTKPEEIGLNIISEFRDRYNIPVGLSDHSGKIFPGLAAATMGCNILEVHVTFDRDLFGPDAVASLTFSELKQLVEGVRFIEAMRYSPVDKSAVSANANELRFIFQKSLVFSKSLPAGEAISREHLKAVKPCKGIPASELYQVLGKKTTRPVSAGEYLKETDFT